MSPVLIKQAGLRGCSMCPHQQHAHTVRVQDSSTTQTDLRGTGKIVVSSCELPLQCLPSLALLTKINPCRHAAMAHDCCLAALTAPRGASGIFPQHFGPRQLRQRWESSGLLVSPPEGGLLLHRGALLRQRHIQHAERAAAPARHGRPGIRRPRARPPEVNRTSRPRGLAFRRAQLRRPLLVA